MPLENEYSGDKQWKKFCSLHKERPMSQETYIGNEEQFSFLGELDEDTIEFLDVAISIMGVRRTLNWLNCDIPALDNETPLKCIIASFESMNMKKRMREYLLRFPA